MKALALLLFFCCVPPVHAGEAEQVFERTRDSVMRISTLDERGLPDGEGSGVVIGPAQVVTNCHVVHEANTILVYAGAKKFPATWTLADLKRDLCLLQVAGLPAPASALRSSEELTKGEQVFAVGNPLGFGLSVSSGLISNLNRSTAETQILTSAPISPGSSGGGLFDAQGRLVGITTGFYFGAQNLNIALPAEWIRELVQRGTPVPAAAHPGPDPEWEASAESLQNAGDWGKLSEWAQRWEKAWPGSSMALRYLGYSLIRTERYREAEQALLSALEKDPRDAGALSYLAIAHRALGDKKIAFEELQRALALHPSSGYEYRLLASWHREDGNLDQGLASAQASLRMTPWDTDSWEISGELLQKKGRYQEAQEAYRAVLRLRPNDPVASSNLASILAYRGETEAARRTLSDSSGKKGNDGQTWQNIGAAEERKERYPEAEKAYRKALDLDPTLASAWNGLGGILVRSGRDREAEEAYRQATKLKAAPGTAWFNLGVVLRDRGDTAGAQAAFEAATVADPKYFTAWYSLGLLQRDRKNLPQAAAALETASSLDPSKCEVWAVLGETRLRLGHREAGFQALQEAEKLDPKNEAALIELARYFGENKDYERALLYADRALEINSASAVSWSSKGYSLLKLKRLPEALQALETAVRLQPDFSNAWINLGEAYLRQKLAGKAIVALEKALQLAPGAADARLLVSQAYVGTGQYAKAQVHIEKALQQAPAFADAWVLRTILLVQENKKIEAESAYGKLKSLNPKLAQELYQQYRRAGRVLDWAE